MIIKYQPFQVFRFISVNRIIIFVCLCEVGVMEAGVKEATGYRVVFWIASVLLCGTFFLWLCVHWLTEHKLMSAEE